MGAVAPDEAIIVGAGFGGLCTAWRLVRLGLQRITILERHRVGHVEGASHGRSRLSSCLGFEEPMLSLVRVAQEEAWPALEADLGRRFSRRIPGLGFGPLGEGFRRRAQAAFALGDAVRALEGGEARRFAPRLRRREGIGVLRDGTATLIAAEAAYDALLAWLQERGVRVVPNTRVASIHSTADAMWLETDRGRRVAERVIVCAGVGSAALIGRLEERLAPRREVSAFFALDLPEAEWGVGRFSPFRMFAEDGPVWSGLPEFADRGVKVSCHLPDDPDEALREAVGRISAWFQEAFDVGVTRVLGTEVRRVVRVTDRPMLVDTHYDDPRIVFAVGADGHEVAIAPLVGRILAELSLRGRSEVSAFQRSRRAFAIPRRGLKEARQRARARPVI